MHDTSASDRAGINEALQQATDLADAGCTTAIDVLARAIERYGDVAQLPAR